MKMQAMITIRLDPKDNAEAARVIAILKDLEITYEDGDVEGRKWIQVSGSVDADDLASFLSPLTSD